MNNISAAIKTPEIMTGEFVPMNSPDAAKTTPPVMIRGIQPVDGGTASSLLDHKKQTDSTAMEEKEAIETAALLNEYMDDLQTNLGFTIRKDLDNQVIVEIKNRKTDEIIKQIPTKEMLAIKEKMAELTGLIFDESV